MQGIRNEKKRSLFKRERKHRLKSITILPSLVSLMNGLCGFFSITFASRDEFGMAGFLIILAMVADALDGRLARMSKSTSSFGGQLDSLCDVISFGAAPAFMLLKVLEFELKLKPIFFTESSFSQRFIWLAVASYISCSIIRLARFNVENAEDESAHMSFIGLPIPSAAGVIVSLLLFYMKYHAEYPMVNYILYALPCITLGTAILMVSRIRYPHVINQYLKGKKPFGYLIKILLFLLFLLSLKVEGTLVLIFCGFALSSLIKWIFYRTALLLHLYKWQNKARKNVDEPMESHPQLH